ncbi:MAG: potassium-transporting ATPase subunit KdpC [Pseudomonadota bacterium]
MLERIFKELRISITLLFFLTIITGILYPALITVSAQSFFPWRANGSLLKRNDIIVGSALIGQSFTDPQYFWGRPSATTPFPYNAENSMGSNYGPLNASYLALVKTRKKVLEGADIQNHQSVPIDLLTASGSGLDPEISPQAAFYQTYRVATARQLSEDKVQNLVRKYVQNPDLDLLGEARVNILALNLALDELDKAEKLHQPSSVKVETVEKVEKVDKHKSKHKAP